MVATFKRLFHSEQGLQGAAGLLVITMVLSNALGFLRDLILANTIPLATLDSYYAAFRIPDFLFNLFILGAISSAFIPVFLKLKHEQGDEAAGRLANNLVTTALVILVILGTFLYIFMPTILPWFVPGFDAVRLDQTISLARILLFSPFFFAGSYVVGGMLNAHKKFFAYSLAPLVYNLSIIVGGLLSLRYGISAVAWMVVFGAFLHLFVQLPVLKELKFRYRFVLDWRDKGLKQVVKLMIPRSISLGMQQVMLVVFTSLGSALPKGAVSIFSLTNNFQTTPVAIFASSIATAVFPHLGATASEKNDAQYRELLTNSLRGMFYTIIPSTVLFWVFRAHFIRLYLALNHQTWTDTLRAIHTFEWFILALAAQGFNIIIIRAFYARHDTLRPMILSVVGGLISIVSAIILVNRMGDVPALSLAFLIGVSIEAVLLAVVFSVTYPRLVDWLRVATSVVVTGCFSVVAGLVTLGVLRVISDGAWHIVPAQGTDRVGALAQALAVAGLAGVVVFLGLSLIFKRSELLWVIPKKALAIIPMVDPESIAKDEGFTSS